MTPAIIAHRGASADAPENTLAAFRLAWDQGADAIETDLRLTRDGRIAAIHDDTLWRVAGRDARVSELTAADLREFDAGSWKAERWKGERVPLLDELLAALPAHGRVFLELKDGPEMLTELRRCLRDSGLAEARVCVISFDRSLLAASKRAMPAVEHGWIVDRPAIHTAARMISIAAGEGLDAVDFRSDWRIEAGRVRLAHRAGLKVYVWTVDDPALGEEFARAGVDGITTNMPGRMKRALS